MTRIEKCRALLTEKGINGILLSGGLNQRYLTDFKSDDGLVLLTPKALYLLTDFRYEEEAAKHSRPGTQVISTSAKLAFISDTLSGTGKRLGYEDEIMSCAEFERAKRFLSDFELIPISREMNRIRSVKEAEELDRIARAQEITDAAFTHILSVMRPEMTETEVALELEFFMRRSGAEGLAFETIAVSGGASALPHGKPRNLKLQPGFLTMDFGAMWQGYCSDMTRTVVIGRADKEMKRLYNTVLKAQAAALEKICSGAKCAETDRVARDIIDDSGYAGMFGHSLGHGVGMYIHEDPRLSGRSEEVLRVGHVVTVEPGIYISGRYGCRIEDMVAVTEDGCRNFTKSQKELIELF